MARLSLSDLKRFLAVDSECPYWMGVDVHKNSYHIALRRADESVFTWSAPVLTINYRQKRNQQFLLSSSYRFYTDVSLLIRFAFRILNCQYGDSL